MVRSAFAKKWDDNGTEDGSILDSGGKFKNWQRKLDYLSKVESSNTHQIWKIRCLTEVESTSDWSMLDVGKTKNSIIEH